MLHTFRIEIRGVPSRQTGTMRNYLYSQHTYNILKELIPIHDRCFLYHLSWKLVIWILLLKQVISWSVALQLLGVANQHSLDLCRILVNQLENVEKLHTFSYLVYFSLYSQYTVEAYCFDDAWNVVNCSFGDRCWRSKSNTMENLSSSSNCFRLSTL